jgi:hypothetical protein
MSTNPDPQNESPDDRATRGMTAREKSAYYAEQRAQQMRREIDEEIEAALEDAP